MEWCTSSDLLGVCSSLLGESFFFLTIYICFCNFIIIFGFKVCGCNIYVRLFMIIYVKEDYVYVLIFLSLCKVNYDYLCKIILLSCEEIGNSGN